MNEWEINSTISGYELKIDRKLIGYYDTLLEAISHLESIIEGDVSL